VNRRQFIALLGGAAVAWPLAAGAQQTTKSRKVGLLHPGESTVVNMRVAAIREGLNGPDNQRDLSFEIIVRLADGDVSRLPSLATDLVNNRVDAIVAAAPPAVQAAAGATTSIPVIAIDLESDPVASGFLRSLARPGGNVTGVFLDFPDFSAKCLQLLIESVPMLSGVGILWDPTTGSLQLKAVQEAAQGFGITAQVFEARRAADIAEAFYALDRSRMQGLLLLSSPLVAGNPQLIRTSRSEKIFRRSPCSPRLQERAGCSAMGRTSRISFVRSGGWRARSCRARKWPSCRRSGRRASNSSRI
jgi:putative ABC transport system substrate-binding protein